MYVSSVTAGQRYIDRCTLMTDIDASARRCGGGGGSRNFDLGGSHTFFDFREGGYYVGLAIL